MENVVIDNNESFEKIYVNGHEYWIMTGSLDKITQLESQGFTVGPQVPASCSCANKTFENALFLGLGFLLGVMFIAFIIRLIMRRNDQNVGVDYREIDERIKRGELWQNRKS